MLGLPRVRPAGRTTLGRTMSEIFLIADEEWVVNDVRGALESDGHSVRVEGDPRVAVDAVVEASPQAAVIDMQVGSMGGMAVTRSIRNAAAQSGSPTPTLVLLLDRDADAFLAGRSGATRWLRKPFSSHDLRQAVADVAPATEEAS